jgi:hypothetical protein
VNSAGIFDAPLVDQLDSNARSKDRNRDRGSDRGTTAASPGLSHAVSRFPSISLSDGQTITHQRVHDVLTIEKLTKTLEVLSEHHEAV